MMVQTELDFNGPYDPDHIVGHAKFEEVNDADSTED